MKNDDALYPDLDVFLDWLISRMTSPQIDALRRQARVDYGRTPDDKPLYTALRQFLRRMNDVQ